MVKNTHTKDRKEKIKKNKRKCKLTSLPALNMRSHLLWFILFGLFCIIIFSTLSQKWESPRGKKSACCLLANMRSENLSPSQKKTIIMGMKCFLSASSGKAKQYKVIKYLKKKKNPQEKKLKIHRESNYTNNTLRWKLNSRGKKGRTAFLILKLMPMIELEKSKNNSGKLHCHEVKRKKKRNFPRM